MYGGVHQKTKGIYYKTRLNSSLALYGSGDVEKGRLLTYLYVWAHQVYSIYMMGEATSHHYHALGCLYLSQICFEIGSILWNLLVQVTIVVNNGSKGFNESQCYLFDVPPSDSAFKMQQAILITMILRLCSTCVLLCNFDHNEIIPKLFYL